MAGDLRVNSASLQELAVDRESGLTHRVDIVAPALKQLSVSLIATEVSISVLAPMVEKAAAAASSNRLKLFYEI
ncbi:hypothetical protein TRIUR3_23175 [Triticum urartu]|uniref:Uncharacterized protein n=1 Tax=Triticum urartu TaxID=4572 RepID=M8AAS4_TRIUA|nr:hypothetical protein TRIUR3_23175 [Triticum urartu]